jgi:hypothetical protein
MFGKGVVWDVCEWEEIQRHLIIEFLIVLNNYNE